MSAPEQTLLTPADEKENLLSKRGLAIYEEKLRPLLEPFHNNEFVSIHIGTEKYTLGASSGDALRAIRKHHPHGWLVIVKIGNEPEWGLAARLLVGQMTAGQQKRLLGNGGTAFRASA